MYIIFPVYSHGYTITCITFLKVLSLKKKNPQWTYLEDVKCSEIVYVMFAPIKNWHNTLPESVIRLLLFEFYTGNKEEGSRLL